MSAFVCSPRCIHIPGQTGRIAPTAQGAAVGVARLPTDPLFYANLTLNTIVSGSRYRITRADTGAELATGVASSSTEVVSAVPCFANPQTVIITIRQGTSAPKYQPYQTQADITKSGGAAYIAQIPDPIA